MKKRDRMRELFCKEISENIQDDGAGYVEFLQDIATKAFSLSESYEVGKKVGQAINRWQDSDVSIDDLIVEVAQEGVFLNLDAADHGGPWLSPISSCRQIVQEPYVKDVIENLFKRSPEGRLATTSLDGAWWTGRSFSNLSIINSHGVSKAISDLKNIIPVDSFWSTLDLSEVEKVVEVNQSAFGLMQSLCRIARLSEDELASIEAALPGWLFENVEQLAELAGSAGALQYNPLGFVLELYRMLGEVKMSVGNIQFATGSNRDYVCSFIFEDLINAHPGTESDSIGSIIFNFAKKVHMERLSVSRTKGRKERIDALRKARESIENSRGQITECLLKRLSESDWKRLAKNSKSESLKIGRILNSYL